MTSAELFDLITSALATLEPDLSTERGKRVYLAYTASRIGQVGGEDRVLERRLSELRKDLSL
jgi:hypothetical protein